MKSGTSECRAVLPHDIVLGCFLKKKCTLFFEAKTLKTLPPACQTYDETTVYKPNCIDNSLVTLFGDAQDFSKQGGYIINPDYPLEADSKNTDWIDAVCSKLPLNVQIHFPVAFKNVTFMIRRFPHLQAHESSANCVATREPCKTDAFSIRALSQTTKTELYSQICELDPTSEVNLYQWKTAKNVQTLEFNLDLDLNSRADGFGQPHIFEFIVLRCQFYEKIVHGSIEYGLDIYQDALFPRSGSRVWAKLICDVDKLFLPLDLEQDPADDVNQLSLICDSESAKWNSTVNMDKCVTFAEAEEARDAYWRTKYASEEQPTENQIVEVVIPARSKWYIIGGVCVGIVFTFLLILMAYFCCKHKYHAKSDNSIQLACFCWYRIRKYFSQQLKRKQRAGQMNEYMKDEPNCLYSLCGCCCYQHSPPQIPSNLPYQPSIRSAAYMSDNTLMMNSYMHNSTYPTYDGSMALAQPQSEVVGRRGLDPHFGSYSRTLTTPHSSFEGMPLILGKKLYPSNVSFTSKSMQPSASPLFPTIDPRLNGFPVHRAQSIMTMGRPLPSTPMQQPLLFAPLPPLSRQNSLSTCELLIRY
ncbi:hypothetical protein Ciccas_010528 [Cichlidogyrus casuarinus]|uniref:ZP domain-containing protein n=1 Tax=Cichlidogyrus casuarinus TaxID=1844966 RepID=A0ABD2PTV4_9PLAT